jgi:hypothetical protein
MRPKIGQFRIGEESSGSRGWDLRPGSQADEHRRDVDDTPGHVSRPIDRRGSFRADCRDTTRTIGTDARISTLTARHAELGGLARRAAAPAFDVPAAALTHRRCFGSSSRRRHATGRQCREREQNGDKDHQEAPACPSAPGTGEMEAVE